MQQPIEEFLEEYEGTPLSLSDLPKYDQDTLNVFVDETFVDDPFLVFNFEQDISIARKTYEDKIRRAPGIDGDSNKTQGGTFTAFLLWAAAKSICQIPNLNWRKYGNTWYEFKNPPFFMPISTGKSSRLTGTVFKGIRDSSFEEFASQYQIALEQARSGDGPSLANPDLFFLAHNLNNLPNIRFTAMKPHAARRKSTHVWWCFGQRYEKDGALYVPVMVRLHHANGDPILLQEIMKAFERYTSAQ